MSKYDQLQRWEPFDKNLEFFHRIGFNELYCFILIFQREVETKEEKKVRLLKIYKLEQLQNLLSNPLSKSLQPLKTIETKADFIRWLSINFFAAFTLPTKKGNRKKVHIELYNLSGLSDFQIKRYFRFELVRESFNGFDFLLSFSRDIVLINERYLAIKDHDSKLNHIELRSLSGKLLSRITPSFPPKILSSLKNNQIFVYSDLGQYEIYDVYKNKICSSKIGQNTFIYKCISIGNNKLAFACGLPDRGYMPYAVLFDAKNNKFLTSPILIQNIIFNLSEYDVLESLNVLKKWEQEATLKRSMFYYRDKFYSDISEKLATKKINDFPEYKENLLQLFNQFCNKEFSNNKMFSRNQQLVFEKLIEISKSILKYNPNPQTVGKIKKFFSSLGMTGHYLFFQKKPSVNGKDVLDIFSKLEEIFKQDNVIDTLNNYQDHNENKFDTRPTLK